MMAEKKDYAHGELLCVEETITNDTAEETVVEYTCAQNREAGSPERGTLVMTRATSMVDEIIALLGKLDQRNLKIVYQFIKSLF